VIGLALRVLNAWTMRYSANGDFGIVALMAKHMAEGSDFPVFSYGVAYMGGLEPILSAAMVSFFGTDPTAFPINLGTALIGAFLPPLVYVMARDAGGGRRAGIIATLYCLVGSDALFHYSVAPRGGYMTMMVGGMLALWLTCRAVTRENRGGQASKWIYFLIGIAAGLGWWATELVTVFLVSAIMVILAGWRWRMVWRGVVPGLSGFILGSLPWWVWNATHQWVSLDFGSSLGKVSFGKGLASFGDLFLDIVEMPATGVGALRLILLIGLVLGFFGILFWDAVRGKNRQTFYYRLAMPVLLVVLVLFYSTSHFVRAHACRYLLPVVPVLAVAIGVSCDALLRRFRFPWGWIAAILVIPSQILLLFHLPDGVPADRARWQLAERLEQQVGAFCDNTFVGEYYTYHWLNYASREKLCVAALPMERVASYALRAELAERRAYLANYRGLDVFLTGTGGKSRQVSVDGVVVDYDLTPPSPGWDYVSPTNIVEVQGAEEGDVERVLLDSSVFTAWDVAIPPESKKDLDMKFKHPVFLSGIRLLSMHNRYPGMVSVEGREDGGDRAWRTLLEPTPATSYFWSGSHVMIDGVQYVQEFRFSAPTGGVTQVRLIFHNKGKTEEAISLSEVLLLEQSSAPPSAPPSVDECVAALREGGIRRFYAPRWLSERIALATSREWKTVVPSLLFRQQNELPEDDSSQPVPFTLCERTGLLVDARDAPRSRVVLNRTGARWKERPLGSLILFLVAREAPVAANTRPARFFWTELGCLTGYSNKEVAQRLFESAKTHQGRDECLPALDDLREAVRLYPHHYPAREILVSLLKQAGLESEATVHEAALQAIARPAIPASIRFGNGVEFLGVTLGDHRVRRGNSLPITYFWKCPPGVNPEKWAVFVHVEQDSARFQDDHVLLLTIPSNRLERPLFDEIYTESRTIQVPASLPPGEYKIRLGLLDQTTQRRDSVSTRLPHRKNATELPVRVTLLP